METLIALYLAAHASTGPIVPAYKVGNCYSVSEPEWRPGVIKITDIVNAEYKYTVWTPENKTWTQEFSNDIDTIEHVYESETKCP